MNEVRCQAKIVDVSLYPRQAKISRGLRASLSAGLNRLIIAPLPPAITQDSLRAQADASCRIMEVLVEDRVVEAQDPESLHARLDAEREGLSQELLRVGGRIRALNDELALFSRRESILDLLDKERPKLISVDYWKDFLEFLESRLGNNRAQARAEIFSFLETKEHLSAIESQLSAIASQDVRSEHSVCLIVDAPAAGDYDFSISCLQSNAWWHPAYSLRVMPESRSMDIAFYAMVRQETGEDWAGVSLLFSTAMPLSDCRLPELRSRRLREAQMEVITRVAPKGFGAASVRRMDAFAAADEEMEEMDKDCCAEPEPCMDAPAPREEMKKELKAKVAASGGMSRSRAASMPTSMSTAPGGAMFDAPSPPPSVPRPAPASQVSGLTETDSGFGFRELYSGINAADAELSRLPQTSGLPAFFRDYLALRERPIAPSLPSGGLDRVNEFFQRGSDPEVSCGGFDYRYKAGREKNDLPSLSAYAQIPVETLSLAARLVHVAVPAEKQQAYLKAVFSHKGNPLPAGPAQIFLGNDFVAGIHLPTLGSDQEAAVSLGVDKDVKVLRKENSKARTKGLAGKDMITDFTVSIEIVSFKDRELEIEIYDRVPVSHNPKEVELLDLRYSKKPARVSDRGVVLWMEKIKPREKLSLEISYSIRLKEDYRIVLTRDSSPHDGSWVEE